MFISIFRYNICHANYIYKITLYKYLGLNLPARLVRAVDVEKKSCEEKLLQPFSGMFQRKSEGNMTFRKYTDDFFFNNVCIYVDKLNQTSGCLSETLIVKIYTVYSCMVHNY